MKLKKIEQEHYGNLAIDNRENDVVMIWDEEVSRTGKKAIDVVHVLRENLPAFIKQLQHCEKGKTNETTKEVL